MATVLRRMKQRRSSAADLASDVLLLGEFGVTTDTDKVWMGDGVTPGGKFQLGDLVNPMTDAGSMIMGGTGGSPQELAPGGDGEILTMVAGMPTWQSNEGANPMTAAGSMIIGGTGGVQEELAAGTDGKHLVMVAGLPAWTTVTTGMANPMTAAGSIIIGETAGIPAELFAGTDTYVFTMVGGMPTWAAPASGLPDTDSTSAEGYVLTLDSGLSPIWQDPGFGTGSVDENRMYAVAVTLLRPSKLKWKVGSFGTYVPSERIYARIINLVRMGADANIYSSGIYNGIRAFDFTPINAGVNVTAHGASSVFCYVTETDVAAVANAKLTYFRMMADITRSATISHVQNRQAGAGSGGSALTGSTATAISPATYGSLVIEGEGEGYEADIIGTTGAVDYVTASLGPKSALTADGTNNQWIHQWWGRLPLALPLAGTMDSQTFTWKLKVYTANVQYDAWANLRVATIPSNWDNDSTVTATGSGGFDNPMTAAGSLIIGGTGGSPQELAAGTNGYILTMTAGTPAWAASPTLSSLKAILHTRAAKTATYNVVIGDKGKLIEATSGTWDLTFDAAATLTDNFTLSVFNSGSGVITLNPNGAETIRDAASSASTKTLAQGEGCFIVCNGTSFLMFKNGADVGFANPMTTAGDIIYGGVSGAATRLAAGSDGLYLKLVSGTPSWAAATGFANPMTTAGDIIYGGSSGTATRLAVGSDGLYLKLVSGAPAWAAATGFANPMTTAGDIIIGGASGVATRLAAGTDTYILTMVSGAPAWATASAGFANPMTTSGDIIYGGASGVATRLAAGTNGYVLTLTAGVPVWAAATGGTSGTKTLCRWTMFDAVAPSATFATFSSRNVIPVYEFDAAADEYLIFLGIIPEATVLTGGVNVKITWMGATATSGNTIWATSFERCNTDLDTDSFASANNSAASAANGTSGITTTTTIAHSSSQIDGLAAGEMFRLKVSRLGSNGSDSMTGDAQLVMVELQIQ